MSNKKNIRIIVIPGMKEEIEKEKLLIKKLFDALADFISQVIRKSP